MRLQIDVETSAGVKLGSGPITSATDWKITNRLDRAGEFSFRIPLAEQQYAVLAARTYVRAWGMIAGVWTQLGLGIVDTIHEDSSADPSMATVSGSNIMRELTWRSVKSLLISEPGYVPPEDAHYVALDGSGSGEEANPNLYHVESTFFDGNAGTWNGLVTGQYDYYYFGYSRIFGEVKFTLHSFSSATPGVDTKVQYFNGVDWVDLTYTDGTKIAANPWKQNGSWTFTPPADWVPLVQNAAATGDPPNNLNDYWLRFNNYGSSTGFEINEITILTDVDTLTGAQLIMALAPAGWSLTGYTTTLTAVYLQLGDETILDALNSLASITGEHFRLSGIGSAREIEWLRTDATSSGIVAMRNGEPSLVAANPLACLIAELHKTSDSIDMVSRVIPYGAGHGSARLTLEHTTRSAPGGYTLDTANNYLKLDATEASYGQTERVQVWSNIGPASSATADLEPAANALFDAALYWLSTHSAVVDSYALTVHALSGIVKVGNTIRVDWLEVVDGVAIRVVNTDLIVLEGAYQVNQDGTYSVAFTVSNLARWPLSEADAIAKLMAGQRAMASIEQPVALHAISSPNAAISVVQTASGFGGLSYKP
jgi:hypothetical protein